MKLIPFHITHPASSRWEAVNSTHGKLVSRKLKRDLIETLEDTYFGDIIADVVFVPKNRIK